MARVQVSKRRGRIDRLFLYPSCPVSLDIRLFWFPLFPVTLDIRHIFEQLGTGHIPPGEGWVVGFWGNHMVFV